MRNTHNTYGAVSKFFHWLIAVLVIVMLCAGVAFNYFPKNNFYRTLMFIHKSTGVTILILMVTRLLWRWINPLPTFPITMPAWQKIAARIVHFAFYIVLIAMPITGIVMSLAGNHKVPFWFFGNIYFSFIPFDKALSELMYAWHGYLAWTIGVLLAIHTLAALKHHFIDKDDVLKRMWKRTWAQFLRSKNAASDG